VEIVAFKSDRRYFGINLSRIQEFTVLKNIKDKNTFPRWVDGSVSYREQRVPFVRLWKRLKLNPPGREVGIVMRNAKIVVVIPKVIGLFDLEIKEDFGVSITKYFEGAVIFKDTPLIMVNPIALYGKNMEKLIKNA